MQARMGSTRLPGKVLADIAGRPMLARVLTRLGRASTLDRIVVATSTAAGDDALAAWCAKEGWTVHRGPEHDVLARYHAAAEAEDADVVVRVTSDCPLIDPDVVNEVVKERERTDADYASNILPPRSFPRGLDVEAIIRDALAAANAEDADPASREHVTPYIYRHPDRFRLARVAAPVDRSDLRWTVDTPEDLGVVRSIYRHFGHDRFTWQDALAACDAHPEWHEINAHVRQKDVP